MDLNTSILFLHIEKSLVESCGLVRNGNTNTRFSLYFNLCVLLFKPLLQKEWYIFILTLSVKLSLTLHAFCPLIYLMDHFVVLGCDHNPQIWDDLAKFLNFVLHFILLNLCKCVSILIQLFILMCYYGSRIKVWWRYYWDSCFWSQNFLSYPLYLLRKELFDVDFKLQARNLFQ